MGFFDIALIFFWCALIMGGLAAAFWYMIKLEYWLSEKAYRAYERSALRYLIKRRVRPDYWDKAMLALHFIWLGKAYMLGGLFLAFQGKDYGYGIFLVAFFAWGVATRASDDALKPRPINDPYLLMWWECGRLHPPPYVAFG